MRLMLRKLHILKCLPPTLTLTLKSMNGERLKLKLYDKCEDLIFSIVNYPFDNSSIPSSPAYGVYISHAMATQTRLCCC